MKNIKCLSMVTARLLLVTAAVFSGMFVGVNETAGLTPPPVVVIGTSQPESDTTAAGWDTTPAPGNWGGRGADGSFAVVWEKVSPDVPMLFGRWAEVTIPGRPRVYPTKLTIGFLAGLANDSYCIYVKGACTTCPNPPSSDLYIEVGCYIDDTTNTNETWVTRDFDLPPNILRAGQAVTLKIEATGNAWPNFSTWGQLAVDYITVWGIDFH